MPQKENLKQKDLLELLVSQLSEFAIVLCDADGRFISWHPGVQTHFGYNQEEFIGQKVHLLYPDDQRLTHEPDKELQEAASTGRASDTRLLVKKNGDTVLVEGVTIALRSESGDLAGFGKVLRDGTQQKVDEENRLALAGALDESTVIVRTANGAIQHWTAGCERLYGWPASEAAGQNLFDLLKTTLPSPLKAIQDGLRGTRTWQGELGQIRRDGTKVFVSAQWVLLLDAGGEPMSVIETHTDITPRLLVQKELEAANDALKNMALELERSNQELEEFARIASHDLGAPITSTRWLVDLLATRYCADLEPEGQECLKQIAAGLQRMSDLIDGVLAHALVGKGSIRTTESIPADVAVSAALENLRKHFESSGAVIQYESLPGVYVQPQLLTQLFQNLLSNAIKYRRRDVPVIVRITAEKNGAFWLFGVHDNGIGIEPEWFERIFQPLQRRHGLEIAGSGIGLATCKKIVERVGGEIWVESQIGAGSSFYFTLPGPSPSPDH